MEKSVMFFLIYAVFILLYKNINFSSFSSTFKKGGLQNYLW